MPFFSVVIPCYNKANVISVTINSVLEQNCDDFEVIIIDDGSTDNSVKVIQSFNDNRIKIIKQKNQGVSVARNRGIDNANGEWIAFLDADDWWHPEYLQQVVNTVKSIPDAKFVASQFSKISDTAKWLPKTIELQQPISKKIINDLPKTWFLEDPFFTSSVCLSLKFLNQYTQWFLEGESYGEDLELWFRLAEEVPIYHILAKLVAYRTAQSDSLSGQTKLFTMPLHLITMQQRLKEGLVPLNLITSTQRFVQYQKLFCARDHILAGERLYALSLVFSAIGAITTKRWWMVFLMTLIAPKQFILNWIERRKSIS